MSELDPDDGSMVAADYSLGSLDAAGWRAAELRMARDPAFRNEVESWQAMLSPLAGTISPVTPPPAVWARIQAAIDPAPPVASRSQPMWSSLNLWRLVSGASTVAAVVAVTMLVTRPEPVQQQLLVATLASSDGSGVITATYDASRGAVILTPAGKSEVDSRTPELWVIEGDNPPRSLGTIDISAPGSKMIPPERLRGLKAGSTLAISLEPKGGSPTGAPTGPVVASGKLTGI